VYGFLVSQGSVRELYLAQYGNARIQFPRIADFFFKSSEEDMNSPDEKVLVERQSPYQYTQDGLELKERADQALIPIFADFMDRGYSPYQICAVVHDSVAETTRDIISIHKSAGKEAADKMIKEKLKS
jgi:hypothetical protein